MSNQYLNVFAKCFDNELTPAFSILMCLWGVIWTNYWKRENEKLSYKWRTLNYKNIEPNRVEYTLKIQNTNLENKIKNKKIQYYPTYKRYLKYIVSFIILFIMVL
jgi:anoctamin-1